MESDPAISETFFELEWSQRNWRALVTVLLCGVMGGVVLYVAVRGFLYQRDIWERYNWVLGLCFLAFGGFFSFIALVAFWGFVAGAKVISRIDSAGVHVGKHHWRWEDMRFIRPTEESSGGINLLIALQGKCDRWFWVGRPLSRSEYEALSKRLWPFLHSHYPDLIESEG